MLRRGGNDFPSWRESASPSAHLTCRFAGSSGLAKSRPAPFVVTRNSPPASGFFFPRQSQGFFHPGRRGRVGVCGVRRVVVTAPVAGVMPSPITAVMLVMFPVGIVAIAVPAMRVPVVLAVSVATMGPYRACHCKRRDHQHAFE